MEGTEISSSANHGDARVFVLKSRLSMRRI